jgi:hypothetical protein
VLRETARLYVQGVKALQGFEVAFNADLETSGPRTYKKAKVGRKLSQMGKSQAPESSTVGPSNEVNCESFISEVDTSQVESAPAPAMHLAELLKFCRDAANRILFKFGLCAEAEGDLETALRQGLRIGRGLAQAEALISNAQSMALAKNMGVSGRAQKSFYEWVVEQAQSQSWNVKDAFSLLNGMPDPDFPSQIMRIDGHLLIRPNRKPVNESSFRTQFYLAKSRKKKKV